MTSQAGLRAASMILSIATTAVIARYLSVEEFSSFSRVFAYIGFFGLFADLGFGLVVIRNSKGDPVRADSLVRQIAGFSALYAIPLFLVGTGVGLLVFNGNPTVQLGILILSPGIITGIVAASYAPSFQTKMKLHQLVGVDVATRLVLFMATVVIVLIDPAQSLMWLFVSSTAISLVQLLAIRRLSGVGRETLQLRSTTRLIRDNWPFIISAMLVFLYMKVDSLIITIIGDDEAVATYAIAYRVFQAVLVGAGIASATLIARMAQMEEGDALGQMFRASSRFSLALGLMVGVTGILSSKLAMIIAGGSDYSSGGPVLQLLFVSAMLAYANTFAGPAIALLGLRRLYLLIQAFNVALNIALNVILIPRWGALGAAMAMVITSFMGFVGAYTVLWRKTGLFVKWPVALKTLVAASLALAAGWSLNAVLVEPVGALAAGLMLVVLLPWAGLVRVDEVKGLVKPRTGQ